MRKQKQQPTEEDIALCKEINSIINATLDKLRATKNRIYIRDIPEQLEELGVFQYEPFQYFLANFFQVVKTMGGQTVLEYREKDPILDNGWFDDACLKELILLSDYRSWLAMGRYIKKERDQMMEYFNDAGVRLFLLYFAEEIMTQEEAKQQGFFIRSVGSRQEQ